MPPPSSWKTPRSRLVRSYVSSYRRAQVIGSEVQRGGSATQPDTTVRVTQAQEVHLEQAQRLARQVIELRDDRAVLRAAS